MKPGTRVGAYEIERVLGSGAMGVVVAARHIEAREPIAMKILHEAHSENTEIRERFLREGSTARVLQSDNVVRVHDVGQLDSGQPYIVMERLSGTDFEALLRARGPLPIPFVVDAALRACSALAEAHGFGIVHRDLKPSNFFMARGPDATWVIKLLDFGISKGASWQGPSMTATSMTLGSPPYMAPEQIRCSKLVDRRADIWSLGVTMFELLTGELPFPGDSFGTIAASILMDPPRRLEELRPDVPAELSAIIARCLSKEREQRYGSVDELALELSELAVRLPPAEPIALPEPGRSERAERVADLGMAQTVLASNAGPVGSSISQALFTGVVAGLGVALLITLVTLIALLGRLL